MNDLQLNMQAKFEKLVEEYEAAGLDMSEILLAFHLAGVKVYMPDGSTPYEVN